MRAANERERDGGVPRSHCPCDGATISQIEGRSETRRERTGKPTKAEMVVGWPQTGAGSNDFWHVSQIIVHIWPGGSGSRGGN